MARVVRRCFLLGDDPVTGKNYDHRKVWIEEQSLVNRERSEELAAMLAIACQCRLKLLATES